MATATKNNWVQHAILGTACALVVCLYGYIARTGPLDIASRNGGADSAYNLLAQGFRNGQLSLKKEPPPGFARLANPYDPIANEHYRNVPYRLQDLSYYKGRFYIYFGPAPALLLFWPYVALTGHCLSHTAGVIIFCALGFLVSVGLLRAVWRRYFPTSSYGVVIACVMALGLATGTLVMMAQSAIYQVAISCGYLLTMMTLAALWRAVHSPEQRGGWLAAASLIYGLAVAARMNLLFGAVILLVPIIQARRERRPISALFLSAIGPIMFIGLGLLLYNYRRFDDPFEFGLRYQLAGNVQGHPQLFSWRYFWINFRVYFLELVHWNSHFPFAHVSDEALVANGHFLVESPIGILTNIPLAWLALAAPLTWRCQAAEPRRALRSFLTILILDVSAVVLSLIFLYAANFRYTIDFFPAWVLLAVIGILGLEQALAGRPVWRRVGRCGWVGILIFSVGLNLLVSLELSARTDAESARSENEVGMALAQMGRFTEAIGFYEQAVRCEPDFVEAHYYLGIALERTGQIPEAIHHYQEALRLRPDFAGARESLTRLQAAP